MVNSKMIDMYICPGCGDEYLDEEDAVDCCPREADRVTRYQCGECSETYIDGEESDECCKDE